MGIFATLRAEAGGAFSYGLFMGFLTWLPICHRTSGAMTGSDLWNEKPVNVKLTLPA